MLALPLLVGIIRQAGAQVNLLLLLAYPALTWLVRSWLSNPYYSHGFLVPLIVGLLLWRLGRLARQEPRRGQTWAGLALTVSALAAAIWTLRWQNYVLTWLALIGLVIGILLFLEGWRRVRHWLFPLLFLALMVPLPFIDLVSPWLESFTAHTATNLAAGCAPWWRWSPWRYFGCIWCRGACGPRR